MRRYFSLGIALVFILSVAHSKAFAQQITKSSIEAKKQQLQSLETDIGQQKKRIAEIENQIKTITSLQAELSTIQQKIEQLGVQANELRKKIPAEEELIFAESPARKLIAVEDTGYYVLEFNGIRRSVTLHGISMERGLLPQVAKTVRKKLVKKYIFVRCIDSACNSAYLYEDKSLKSLNALLIESGSLYQM